MGKNSNVILIGGLFLASFLLLPSSVLAYNDQTTHPDLIRETISFYELSTGKKLTDEQKQWVAQGSIDEDKAPRWLNHFYDPAFERGLSTTIAEFGYAGYSAKNWARFSSYQTLNPSNLANLWTGNGPVISGSWWGDFSYEAAIKSYSKSKEKEAYVALGDVLHIIADMTVPEHARNEAHPAGSFYETWTMNNSAGLTQDLGKRVFNQGRKPVIYGDLGTYFNELAGYTNTHFFSPGTINSELYQKPKIIYEDRTFAYGYDENYQLFDLATVTIDRSLKKSYSIKDNNYQIVQEYWTRLSRQAIINGAGIISLFVNEAEAAKKVELAKQKVDSGSTGSPQSSFISFISGLFSSSPDISGPEPAMTIIAGEPKIAAPKINPPTPKTAPIVQPPAASPPAPAAPKVNQVIVPKITPIVQAPAIPPLTPTPTTTPTSTPTPAPAVVSGGGGGTSSSPAEQTPAQTFAAGDLIINEIMYDLAKANCVTDGTDTNHEWVEIYNNSSRAITLTGGNSGWRFNDGSNHLLNEQGTVGSMTIPVGGFAVLSASTTVFLSDHAGFGGTVIDTAMSLKNTSATIKISAPDSTIIDEVTYDSSWGAKHNCKTLERKSATGGSSDSTNWAESSATGGTPGAANNPIAEGEGGPIDDIAAGTGTDVSATTTISQNTTWTLANSPYRLFFDSNYHPTVAAGVTLTIEPGVKIIPQSGAGATAMEIKGTLQAIATSGAPIIFTSKNDTASSTTPAQKGDWLNIVFSANPQDNAPSNLDYVEFRYGGGQNLVSPFYEMVDVAGATININNSKFENSKYTALHLKDSSGVVQNSIFSDNNCGISVDSANGVANVAYGNCYGIHTTGLILSSAGLQIKNNQFIRNQLIGIEVRSGTAPTIDSNIFTDNGYPIKIESSYPAITNSQLANTASSTSSGQATSTFWGGIAISGHTHFSQNFTLKKDLPYILQSNGPALAPYIDVGATLTIEPGTILKTDNTGSVLFVNGSLVASTTPASPIVFTSLKDVPQAGDWGNIRFNASSTGNFQNTSFLYGTPGETNQNRIQIILDESENTGELEITGSNVVSQQFTAGTSATTSTMVFSARKNSTSSADIINISILADDNNNPSSTFYNASEFVMDNSQRNYSIDIYNRLLSGTKYWVRITKTNDSAAAGWIFKSNTKNYGLLTTSVVSFNPQTLSLKITSTISVSVLNVLSIDAAATVVVQ